MSKVDRVVKAKLRLIKKDGLTPTWAGIASVLEFLVLKEKGVYARVCWIDQPTPEVRTIIFRRAPDAAFNVSAFLNKTSLININEWSIDDLWILDPKGGSDVLYLYMTKTEWIYVIHMSEKYQLQAAKVSNKPASSTVSSKAILIEPGNKMALEISDKYYSKVVIIDEENLS